MEEEKECLLGYGICTDCGECDKCDFYEHKLCDNCGACLETDADYAAIVIDHVEMEGD